MSEGYLSHNGINFGFKLTSSPWFGVYECSVHAFFLERPAELNTNDFNIGGYTWQLRLIHKDDGYLAVYLYSRSPDAPRARFSFTIVSHAPDKESRQWGDVHSIENGQCWGFRKLIEVSAIKDRSSGLMLGDVFTVSLALRLLLPENEEFSVRADNTHALITWSLKNPHDMSPYIYVSEEFLIGDTKWQLQFYPEGQKPNKNFASIFLYSHNNSSIKTNVKISCTNNILSSDDISRTLEYTYQDFNEGRGWFEFLAQHAMQDGNFGCLKDGWLTLTVDIALTDLDSAAVHQHPEPAARSANTAGGPLCVICIDKVQTSGVLHGETTHKCFCLDCARMLKRRNEALNCPICGERVERIIENFF